MLILTEKENVAKNYIKALALEKTTRYLYESLDKKIKVTFAAGHIYTLYDAEDYDTKFKTWSEETLPIIPDTYKYKAIKTKENFRKPLEEIIKKAIKEKEEIVIATDPDREGEVIARLILNQCKADYKNVTRIWLTEGLEETEIRKSIENRKTSADYDELYRQGKAQKESDWVMGINLTRAYSILNKDLYSIGRVQTAVLKEIYLREIQIKLFIPRIYYNVLLESENGTFSYLLNKNTKEKKFENLEEVQKLVKDLYFHKEIKVSDIQTKEKKEKPPLLYNLSALEIDAYDIYGISIDRTLEIAQKLYNELGVISYPRTDSRYIGSDDVEHIINLYKRVKQKDNRFDTDESKINKNNSRIFCRPEKKEAHHALIPTTYFEKEESDEWRIYDLILRRFFMQMMKDFEVEEKKVYFECGNEVLITEGKKVKEIGWKKAELRKVSLEDKELKDFTIGQKLKIKEINILEKYTEKPKFYTESTILDYMINPTRENEESEKLLSIGTQATRASIVKVLFERGYIKNEKKHIRITEKGIRIVEQIKENEVLDLNTSTESTTKWDNLVRENPEILIKEIENITKKSIENMRYKMKAVIQRNVVAKCVCGKDIVKGKNGWYCTGYKEGCKIAINEHIYGKQYTEEDIKELFEKKSLPFYDGINKSGDKVRYRLIIENGSLITQYDNDVQSICDCPKCKKSGMYKTKFVYKCSNKDCDFFFYKETYGIVITNELAKKICSGEKVDNVERTMKNGNKENVSIKLDIEEGALQIIR